MTRPVVDQGPAFDQFSASVELPMTALTVAWLPVLIVPLVQPVHGTVASTLDFIDYTIWGLFGLEYVIKLSLAQHRGAFVRSHVLDVVVVVVPFLRPIRTLRLLRVLRAGTVGGDFLHRGKKLLTYKGLHIVLTVALILVVASAAFVTLAERHAKGANIHDFGQGLWWAVVTVTTVGYGDRFPITPLGQGIAVLLMLVGIGLIGTITATVASFFVSEQRDAREDELVARLDRIEVALAQLVGEGKLVSGTSPPGMGASVQSPPATRTH
jgi:voltage-gated potassium channel